MENDEILNVFKNLETGSSFISNNFKRLQEEYPNQFVAVEKELILANGSSFQEVEDKVLNKNKLLHEVLIEFIPDKNQLILF